MKIQSTVSRRLALMAIAAALTLAATPAKDESGGKEARRGPTTFAQIVALDALEYASYQVKITYTGIQTKPSPSVLLAGIARLPGLAEFAPHRTPGIHYGNDDIKAFQLTVSGSTIQKFVEGIGDRPPLQVPGGAAEPLISMMIERGAPPSEIVFEHLADGIDANAIVNVLQGATQTEDATTRELIRRFRNYTVGPN